MYTQSSHYPSLKHLLCHGLMATCIAAFGFAAAIPNTALASTQLKLLGTYSHYGNPSEALSAGTSTKFDGLTYTCAKVGGCTINVEAMADAESSSGSQQHWRIDVLIDGTIANPGALQQGTLVSNTYTTGNMRVTEPVAMGKHTVEVDIYVDDAATLGGYEADYNIYTP